ncbi:MAG: sensor histidine kinase [Hyphomonadaceae bacterium]|nr:sensor histidine kinase [Hyphomonadaceae bacterium]
MSKAPAAIFGRFRALIRRSLAARLLTVAIISVVGLILMGLIAQAQFNARIIRLAVDPEIESVADDLIGNSGPGLNNELVLRDLPFDPRYLQPLSGRYFQVVLIRDDGSLQTQTISPSLVDAEIQIPTEVQRAIAATRAGGPARFFTIDGPDGGDFRIIARVEHIPDVQGRYAFIVGVATSSIIAPAANVVGWAFAVFVAFCALMVMAVTALQVRVGLEPLHELQRDIAAVRRGDAERLQGEYPAEIQPVTEELNALVDHNREVVERARRHVGNLAHALKTPIAVLKNAAAGGAEDAVLKQSIEEMEGFVERQLRRARVAARAEASAGATIAYRTPVLKNLEDLVFMMEQRYDSTKAMDISIEAEGDVTFRGEREDLLEMAANLIDNACKYGKSQVIVRLLPAFDSKGLFEIVVEDDGPGLSDAEIARAMERGARLDEAAPGQGLGLSILQETVELYAGELLFERGQLGGLKARLRLPSTD